MIRVGIFQPEKIGDIVITLPIAKYYADMGYEIIWPVNKSIISHFSKVVDYVKFVEFSTYSDFINKYNCNFILDLCFNIFKNEVFTGLYNSQNDLTFDALKYKIANVPFEEKWRLSINRDVEDELETYRRVVGEGEYVVLHTLTARGPKDMSNIRIPDNCRAIHIDGNMDGKTGIFSWLYTLENAKELILTNSSFLNVVNQLGICDGKRTYIRSTRRNRHIKEHPVLRGEWRII